MPSRCVVGGCGNVPNLEKGIGLHLLPYYGDDRTVALKRRKRWVDFAKLKRAKWEPTEYSHICSAHFEEDCFTRQFHNLLGQVKPFWPHLITDEMGFTVWPKIHAVGAPVDVPQSDRNNRKVRKSSILCIFSNVVKPISSLYSILSSYFRFYRS